MAKEPPQTIGDLRRQGIVTDKEIAAAVDAYLADPKAPPFNFASGHILDVEAAVLANRQAKATLLEPKAREVYQRTMVRVAVILATPSYK